MAHVRLFMCSVCACVRACRYITFTKKCFSEQTVVKVVDEALNDVHPYVDISALVREPYYAIPTEYMHLISPPALPVLRARVFVI